MQADAAVRARGDESRGHAALAPGAPWPLANSAELPSLLRRLAAALVNHVALRAACLAAQCVRFAAAVCSAVVDTVVTWLLDTSLSLPAICGSLFDLRGMGVLSGVAPLGEGEFEGMTAVVVGDAGAVSVRVASEVARGGADTVHLVSGACGGETWRAVGEPPERKGSGDIVSHTVDFSHPGEVSTWCSELCDSLCGQGRQIGILVLGSVAASPKERRLSVDALDQAFAADVISLQSLLVGLGPVLAPGARVVITTSAAAFWQSRAAASSTTGHAHSPAKPGRLDGLEARVHQQAARVALAGHQARKWALEPAGPTGLICTPSVFWSAWTDVLACVGVLELVKEGAFRRWWLSDWLQEGREVVTSRVAGAVVDLCRQGVQASPAECYWGRRQVGGPCRLVEAVSDLDLERMLVALACRSGQLPG